MKAEYKDICYRMDLYHLCRDEIKEQMNLDGCDDCDGYDSSCNYYKSIREMGWDLQNNYGLLIKELGEDII